MHPGTIKPKPAVVVQVARNFINSALTRATQRTQCFVRWVRVRLCQQAPCSESVVRLRESRTLPAGEFSTPNHLREWRRM